MQRYSLQDVGYRSAASQAHSNSVVSNMSIYLFILLQNRARSEPVTIFIRKVSSVELGYVAAA